MTREMGKRSVTQVRGYGMAVMGTGVGAIDRGIKPGSRLRESGELLNKYSELVFKVWLETEYL